LGVNTQNVTLLGECADFLCPFVWSHVSGLMRFLTADRKQHHVNCEQGVSKEFRQIATNDAIFLSRVITGDEAGFMVMTLKQSSDPPNGK
jgi:hypothetical protein